jgi:hypothetical protein
VSERCLFCGKPKDDAHHATARAANRAYLDPDLDPPQCHSHHELDGDDLRTAGLANPATAGTAIESVAVRLRRAAIFLGRLIGFLADCAPGELGEFLTQLARSLQCWADDLDRTVAALDRYSPEWRAIPDL